MCVCIVNQAKLNNGFYAIHTTMDNSVHKYDFTISIKYMNNTWSFIYEKKKKGYNSHTNKQ
jgi:hypothetical protein